MDLTIYFYNDDSPHRPNEGYRLDVYGGKKDVHEQHPDPKHLIKVLKDIILEQLK